MIKVFIYFFPLILCLLTKKVEYRLSRNYGQLIYDFSGNLNHMSNGNSVLTQDFDGKFTDRGLYFSSFAGAMPLKTNPSMLVPNPGTILVWVMTGANAGRVFHQFIDGSNFMYFRKKAADTLYVVYKIGQNLVVNVDGPAGSFLSSNKYTDTWIMLSIIISGRYIKIHQNLSLVLTVDCLSDYTQTYRIVFGSCLQGTLVTDSFFYYFAVFNSDSIQSNFFNPNPSSNCFSGVGTCGSCIYSVNLDYQNESGCISNSFSIIADASGQSCQVGYTCKGNMQFNCLCSSNSCYYNSSNLFQCVESSSGNLLQASSSCSSVGQGCCLNECRECSDQSSCLSCTAINSFLDTDGLCTCSNGFFGTRPLNSASSCSPCSLECSKCISIMTCTECIAFNSEPDVGGCKCIEGYFPIANELTTTDSCHKCQDFCLTCSNYTACDICRALNSFPSGSACLCLPGFYSDSDMKNLNSCKACSDQCKTCSDELLCEICLADNSEPSLSGCICKRGYYMVAAMNQINSCLARARVVV